MAYTNRTIRRAQDLLEQKRRKHEIELRLRKQELYQAEPRLQEIENLLSLNGMKAVSVAVLQKGETGAAIARLRDENLNLQAERAVLLQRMGMPKDALTVSYDCSICKDEGYINGKVCSCMEKLLKRLAYEDLNLTAELNDFDAFRLDYYPDSNDPVAPRKKMEKIFRFCRNYADTFSPQSGNLLMNGGTGLGKTFLSLCIAKTVIDKGYGVIYASAQNLLRALEREKFSSDSSDFVSDSVLECDLLILDDLGSEFATAFTVSAVYNLINTRINSGLPTIISTNLSLVELESIYSERVVSRLIGEYTNLKFAGKDIRQLKKMEAMRHD